MVSVLITNHDYARFLPRAIDSALGQGEDVEVVVVDDGSTDESHDVIRSYGDRITAVRQDQQGQAGALNTAFAASSGDIVCFLDADDWFLPGKVAAVREALRLRPDALVAHHRMQTADTEGRPLWRPWPRQIWDGDVRDRLERSGGWFPHATCSGLAFRRWYLEAVFPLPARSFPGEGPLGPVTVELEPDTYLVGPAAHLGPVAGIPRAFTFYRLHGANKLATAEESADTVNEAIARAFVEFGLLISVLAERFGQRPALRLDDHLEYQLRRRALRRISLPATLVHVARSPMLTAPMKAREAARALAGRGLSRPVVSADRGARRVAAPSSS